MNKKLETLGIFFWIMGGLHLLSALFFLVGGVLGLLGIISPEDSVDDRVIGGVGCIIFAGVVALFGAGHFIVGTGLRRFRPWARTAAIVIGIFDILCCCSVLGLALGIYTLIVLCTQEADAFFAAQKNPAA
jgi:hypothetical protein